MYRICKHTVKKLKLNEGNNDHLRSDVQCPEKFLFILFHNS